MTELSFPPVFKICPMFRPQFIELGLSKVSLAGMDADQDWITSFGTFTEGFNLVIVDGLADQFGSSVCIPQFGGVVRRVKL